MESAGVESRQPVAVVLSGRRTAAWSGWHWQGQAANHLGLHSTWVAKDDFGYNQAQAEAVWPK